MGVVVKKSKGGQGRPSSSAANTPAELPEGMRERISRRAYELWEQRGRQQGNGLRDWLDAEQAVREEVREVRK